MDRDFTVTWPKAAFVGAVAFFVTFFINAMLTYSLNGKIVWHVVWISASFVGVFFAILWKWKLGQLRELKQAAAKGKRI